MPKTASKKKLTSMRGLEQAAECLRTLAHPHRLRIVQLLLRDEYTVGELAESCDIPSHVTSEHLGKMKDRGLLKAERRGRQVFYRIAEPHLADIMRCVEGRFR
jgi:ArsR family transcriptional regulator, zinc-responsive transcriptional repressor